MIGQRLFYCIFFLMLNLCVAAKQKNYGDTINLIRGPYLQVATSHSIIIRWRTDLKTGSRVRYGTTKDKLDKTVYDPTSITEHIVQLSGLAPRTRYYYAIESSASRLQGDANNIFYTLDAGKENLYRVGVFGDCGNNSVNQMNVKKQFIKYLVNKNMDAWILLGDNAYSTGSDAEFQQKFFNIYKDDLLKKYPLFPSPGNHDYNDHSYPGADSIAELTHQIAYYRNFSMPVNAESGGFASHTQAFYSFDIGNIHFLSLDSYGKEDSQYKMYDTLGPQAEWVKKDLEANKNKQWVVAYWHHPPYTMGSHNSDEEDDLVKIRENFITILERYGVDLILCGHSHVYERSRLMKGNYGMENTFDSSVHNLSNSSALYDNSPNSCPFIKDESNKGTVYVVSGSAGQLGGMEKSFPHAAMFYSNAQNGGASVLEVKGNRLDLKWVCADGIIRDHFTMMKDVNKKSVMNVKKGAKVKLTASYNGSYQWNKSALHSKSIIITASAGTATYIVKDKESCLQDVFTVNAR